MDLKQYATQEAKRQGVDPNHILPLIGTESSWNPRAVSPKGAGGLMQLMPATARDLGLSDADRFNPAKAIPAGIRYYKQQLDRFGTPELAYAAYNAGPSAVIKAGGVPDIRETQNYVRKNMANQPPAIETLEEALGYRKKGAPPPSASQPSLDQLEAALGYSKAAAKRLPMKSAPEKPFDPLEGYNFLQRGLIGAGKAGTDFLNGIGVGGMLGLPEGNKKADDALSRDVAAQAGNLLGQAGIMYVGGTALKGAGAALKGGGALLNSADLAARAVGSTMPNMARAAKIVGKPGELLMKAGSAAINPATYKQALGAGAVYGAIAQPGDAGERLMNGVAGGIGGAAGLAVGRAIPAVANRVMAPFKASAPVQTTITTKLQAKGIDFNALPKAVQQQLVKVGKRSMNAIDGMDAQQLARMADFQKLGIQPTRGWVTRDAKDWWLENNLNTVDDQLIARNREANQALLQSVRDGTSQATDYDIGNKLQDTFQGYDQALKAKADRLYSAARDMSGRDITLDPHRFVNSASIELDQQMLGSKLPADTLNWFEKVTSNKEPFNMGTALQRLQALNGRLYSTNDPAEAKALGIVKKHLTDAIEGYGGPQAGGIPRMGADPQQQLAEAFRGARAAAADRFRWQESNPLVDKVLKGQYTPEKLPDMLGSMRVDDLKGLAAIEQQRGVPVMSTLRDAAKAYVRDASTLQAETGGSFTVAGLRRALDKIGPEKGRLLFGKEGWEQYQRVLRAAGNIYNAPIKPAGSSTFPNFMRMLQQTPIPGMPFAVNVATTAATKAGNMAKVGRALNPALQVPRLPAQPSRLPLLTAPLGLLSADQLK